MRVLFAAVLIAAVGCAAHKSQGQVPPTSHTVTITITPPSNASGYTYVVSRAVVSGNTCPVPSVTTPNYTPLNQANPGGAIYVDPSAAGLTACYIAQSVSQGAVSQPSNTAGPFVVPANPGAPSIGGQSAKLETPLVKSPHCFDCFTPTLTASVK